MPMTRAERAQRLAQLREQLNAISAEINRLEREDEGYVAYAQRAQASRQQVLPYAEFAKYAVAFEQLEALYAQAGRPQNWERLPLLMQLRRVLLVPSPGQQPATARAAAGQAAATGARPATTAVAAPARPGVPTQTNDAGGQPTQIIRPASSGVVAAPVPATTAQAAKPADAPKAAEVAKVEAAKAAAARTAEQYAANLAEQHSPILSEVVELLKRAEEEFKSSQLPSGLASVDRAVYLLERVYHAPAAQVTRVVKLLDDTKAGGSQIAEADRARWDSVRERAMALQTEAAA